MKKTKTIVTIFTLISLAQWSAWGASAKKRTSQKVYQVQKCDCIGNYKGIPTFLSDLAGTVDLDATANTRKKAESKVLRQCIANFRSYTRKARPSEISFSGCRVKVSKAGSNRWQEI